MVDDSRRRFLRAQASAPPQVAVSELCLALRGVECRLCVDVCEPRALRFVPALGGVAQLRLNPAACTQCHACEPLCPVAAIRVAVASG